MYEIINRFKISSSHLCDSSFYDVVIHLANIFFRHSILPHCHISGLVWGSSMDRGSRGREHLVCCKRIQGNWNEQIQTKIPNPIVTTPPQCQPTLLLETGGQGCCLGSRRVASSCCSSQLLQSLLSAAASNTSVSAMASAMAVAVSFSNDKISIAPLIAQIIH